MANPRPRKETLEYVATKALKTDKDYRIGEREGKEGEMIIFAVNDADGSPLLDEEDKPIECSYRPLSQNSSYT